MASLLIMMMMMMMIATQLDFIEEMVKTTTDVVI